LNKKHYTNKIYHLRNNIRILFQERKRIESLKIYEKRCLSKGYKFIAGIDEVGRGSLAGPVVAAAVVIKNIEEFFIAFLKDSKKLSRKKRETLFQLIIDKSSSVGIGIVESEIIEKINIAQATFLAMKRAIIGLEKTPDYILVDAFKIPYIRIEQNNIIKGEDSSISIAAASVVAKVYRDKIMQDMHKKYPEYQFNKNSGYGTKRHIIAIKEYGICPIHRKTFKSVLSGKNNLLLFDKN